MIDRFGRRLTVLRISVTDRCNYRCVYCMPEEGVEFIPHERIMRFEEIANVVETAVALGIDRFRLTGGEPLVRKGITHLVTMLASVKGVRELAMTTNGSKLAPLAGALKRAGLDRVNISLDTMNPETFRKLTRGGDIRDVLAGIDAALEAGLTPVKLNIVVSPGEGDADARSVERFAAGKALLTRRIQKMDIRNGVFSIVENGIGGNCAVCNRLRLTSDGFIRCCLMNDLMFDVRRLGAEKALLLAARSKPKCGTGAVKTVSMNRIGG